ncbi:MAG: AbrB/MazE/SpoVT family DNA-binding domain-containing protein [Candidatus Aenigmarchaeota archaeon]|nr:AbrB/MazE/SpoVT family DNA-binding domain-containing protein [Candidatus Aenigmarchaeota archaeon]
MKKYIKCDCSGYMKPSNVEIMHGLFSEGYKCEKCGEVEFNGEQMRKALRKKEEAIKMVVTRRLGMVGGSLILRIPKHVESEMKFKDGEEVRVIVEKNKMIIEPV